MLEKIKNAISSEKEKNKVLPKDAIATEIRRCKSDPSYFARNFVFIRHKEKGAIKFKLWDFQSDCLQAFRNNRMNIVLKARQLGMTELMAMYILWFTLFQRDKTVVVVSRNRSEASKLVKKIKYAYKKLPSWLKVTKMVMDNVFTVEFDNDSVIFADATTDDAGRGTAASLFIIDEAAFIDNLEEMWASVFPTIDNGGSCIIGSTPNGASGQFYDLYQNAPKNGFNSIRLNWDVHPDRDQEWFERTKASMSPKKFSQEFLCDFLLSGDTVIDGNDIQRHELNVERNGENRVEFGPGKDIWAWKEYNHMNRYCMGCDVARGDGEDYSTFTILDVDTREIVCEYRGKIKVDKFAEVIVKTANLYGDCLVVVENNSYGLAVLMKLIELKYKNLYYEERGVGFRTGYVDFENDDIIAGFTTTMKSRILTIDAMEEAFRLNKISTYSKRMIHEMRNFTYGTNGKPQARKGSNDDLIMALSITIFVADLVFSTREEDYEMKRKLLENFKMIEYSASTKVPGEIGYNKDKSIVQVDSSDPYKYKYKDQNVDFRWVIDKKSINEKQEPPRNQGIIFLGVLK